MSSTQTLSVVPAPATQDSQRFGVLKATLILRRDLVFSLLLYPVALCGFIYLWLPNITHYPLSKVLSPGDNQELIATMYQVQSRGNLLVTVLPFLPILVGVFVGAPLFSRQFETGTYKFDWTQGAGRFRMLQSDLLVVLGLAGLGSYLIGLTYQLVWRQPIVLAVNGVASAFDPQNWSGGQILLQPTLYAAETILIVVISMFIGTFIKRVLGAMVCALVTLVLFSVAFPQLHVQSLLVHVHSVTTNDPLGIEPETELKLKAAGFLSAKNGDFQVKQGWLNANGTLSPVQTDAFLKLDANGYAQADPTNGNLLFESGTKYKAIVKKIGQPYVIWWRAPSDYRMWVAGWSIAMTFMTFVLIGLIRLRIGRKS